MSIPSTEESFTLVLFAFIKLTSMFVVWSPIKPFSLHGNLISESPILTIATSVCPLSDLLNATEIFKPNKSNDKVFPSYKASNSIIPRSIFITFAPCNLSRYKALINSFTAFNTKFNNLLLAWILVKYSKLERPINPPAICPLDTCLNDFTLEALILAKSPFPTKPPATSIASPS